MAYFDDYLRTLPSVDAREIMKVINENQETMIIQNLTEEEFKRLIDNVAKQESPQSKAVKLSEKITAEQFNEFYSNVQIDLIHLFLEQNQLEGLSQNYERIFEGNLEDIKNHLDKLKQKVAQLDMQKEGEEGLVVSSYNFDPNQEAKYIETDVAQVSSQLWADRDGMILTPASVSRTFHHYYARLSETVRTNLLEDEEGNRTATVKILYQSPYTIQNNTDSYEIENIIDGNNQSFWYSVALKPNNSVDDVSINPEVIN